MAGIGSMEAVTICMDPVRWRLIHGLRNPNANASGIWIPNYSIGQWMQSGSLWWYLYDAGGFPKAQWEIIGGDWYYFMNPAG